MIRLHDVSVAIQRTPVLNDVSMEIASGRMAGLIGRNGAGKTTLMRSIMGLLPLQKGSIALDEVDLGSVAVVPSDFLNLKGAATTEPTTFRYGPSAGMLHGEPSVSVLIATARWSSVPLRR